MRQSIVSFFCNPDYLNVLLYDQIGISVVSKVVDCANKQQKEMFAAVLT